MWEYNNLSYFKPKLIIKIKCLIYLFNFDISLNLADRFQLVGKVKISGICWLSNNREYSTTQERYWYIRRVLRTSFLRGNF